MSSMLTLKISKKDLQYIIETLQDDSNEFRIDGESQSLRLAEQLQAALNNTKEGK